MRMRDYSTRHWRLKHNPVYRLRVRRAKQNMRGRKQVAFDRWKARGCSRCGEVDIRCIVAHHVDPSKKTETPAKIRSVKRLIAELEHCVALCMNCHAKIHDEMRRGVDARDTVDA